MTKNQQANNWLQTAAIKVSRIHFYYVAVYIVILLMADAWNLITRELVSERWMIAGTMLAVTTIIWYAARARVATITYYRLLILALIVMDIVVASFTIYTERGMASRGVALYAIPIVVAAVMRSRSGIFGTAALCTAAYIMTATRYFYVYFNEGYKIELYTTLTLYSAMFFLLAALLWVTLREQ